MKRSSQTDPSSGAEQVGLRQYNERLILHQVRRAGTISRAELARKTGLSAQAVSVITASLIKDGYLCRGQKERGRVGQPSTPMYLNPEGAYAVGVSVGRRVLSTLVTDFTGTVLKRVERRHAYPDPEPIITAILEDTHQCLDGIPKERLTGIGLAVSSSMERWADRLGAPSDALEGWREIDLTNRLHQELQIPVQIANDVSAAATAELILGEQPLKSSVLYIFLGALVGGGLILNNRIFMGAEGGAGAIGFFPFGALNAPPEQFVDIASLVVLERALETHGLEGAKVIETDFRPPGSEAILSQWRTRTAEAMARLLATTIALLEVEQVVVDGALSHQECEKLLYETEQRFKTLGLSGMRIPEFQIGSIGRHARTLGAAVLPLYERFTPDRDLLLKIAPTRG